MKSRTVAYVVATAIAAVAFIAPGIGNLARIPHIAEDMAHLGYPTYFLTILGAWKVLGALAIALPRLPRIKEWAYAGMIFDLTGAAASRVALGDGIAMMLGPLALAGVVFISWALRPPDRRLDRAAISANTTLPPSAFAEDRG